MASELSQKAESTIPELVAAGGYADRTAVIEEAVALLARSRQELREAIQVGIDSGESVPGEVVFSRLRARALGIAGRPESVR